MSKHVIVPAHDDRVMVEITVPRSDGRKKPLLFRAARWEFQPRSRTRAYAEYIASAIDPKTGEVKDDRVDEMLIDWWIKELGLDEEILDLTPGEKDQIWTIWRDESEVDLGESSPSTD